MRRFHTKQTVFIMTLALVMFVVGFKAELMLTVPSSANESQARRDFRVRFTLQNATLGEAILALAKAKNLNVMFDPELVDSELNRRTLELADESVPAVIEEVAKAFNCFPQIEGDWLSVHSLHPQGLEQIADGVVADAQSFARDKANDEPENKAARMQKVQNYLRSLSAKGEAQDIYLGSLPRDVRKEAFELERRRRWQTVRAKLREYPPWGKVADSIRLHSYLDSGKFPMLGFVVLRGREYTFDYWNTAWIRGKYK